MEATQVDDQQVKSFVEELSEILDLLENAIISLAKNPEDNSILKEILNVAHTLKGNSGFLGLDNLVELSHAMEDTFQLLLNEEHVIDSDVIDLLFECKDKIKDINESLSGGKNASSISTNDLIQKIQISIQEPDDSMSIYESRTNKTEQENKAIESEHLSNYTHIQAAISDEEAAPEIRAFLLEKKISEMGEIIQKYPEEGAVDAEFKKVEFWIQTNRSKEEIEKNIKIELIENLKISDPKNNEKKSISITEPQTSPLINESLPDQHQRNIDISDTIRVPIKELDHLLNLAGELIISNNNFHLVQDLIFKGENTDVVLRKFKDNLKNMQNIASEVKRLIMNARLVPIQQVFNRFKRFVRDYALKNNKKINLVISGGDTELDKKLIEEIIKPLTHIIRNAVDHGVETIKERKIKNKPEMATIQLAAYQKGNFIVVEVKEDGKGLNYEKIIKKAIERRMIPPEEARDISEENIKKFIFKPGFSSKDDVGLISGRGIGLDVARKTIESMNGILEFDSYIDHGTKVTITLPLTMAIIEVFVIRIKEDQYCIPMQSVLEIRRIAQENIFFVTDIEVIQIRDRLIPIIHLNKIIHLEKDENKVKNGLTIEENRSENYLSIIIVEINKEKFAFPIDELLHKQETVIQSLENNYKPVEGISGVSILGDGSISFVIDLQKVISMYKNTSDIDNIESLSSSLQEYGEDSLYRSEMNDPSSQSCEYTDILHKLESFFQEKNKLLMQEWFKEGNGAALRGIRVMTSKNSISIGETKVKFIPMEKAFNLLGQLNDESTKKNIMNFMLPILPIHGSVNLLITSQGAIKLIKLLWEKVNVEVSGIPDHEPLLELINIMGSSYTNSLEHIHDIGIKPGIPAMHHGLDSIIKNIDKNIKQTAQKMLYIKNQFYWESDTVLAKLLIILPGIK